MDDPDRRHVDVAAGIDWDEDVVQPLSGEESTGDAIAHALREEILAGRLTVKGACDNAGRRTDRVYPERRDRRKWWLRARAVVIPALAPR